MRLCDFPGCGRKHDSNGLCHSHAAQVARGRTLTPIAPPMTRMERFWAKVDRSGDCWEWLGSKRCSGGRYGGFYDGARVVAAHRYSWTIHRGPIPDGMVVCHRCDNTQCVNPAHLFVGTQRDNVLDMIAKNRKVILVGEATRVAKLTSDDVRAIRSDHRPAAIVAGDYGVHPSTVYRARKGSTWKHVSSSSRVDHGRVTRKDTP